MSDRALLWLFGLTFILFCSGVILSYQEINYLLIGKEAEAQVFTIKKQKKLVDSMEVEYVIWYRFRNDNTRRMVESYFLTTEPDHYALGDLLQVEYFGEDIFYSRLRGDSQWLGFIIVVFSFFGLLALFKKLSEGGLPQQRPW
ncbi:MAG: hypothetical protein CMF25_08340 [Kangiellaceae bacterium]|jgi:hypothetical protein|nr:hypothetical protein [Kangiellaceae bacterium]|tara:strand:+ start:8766 stop:9194 length:429 start_codon:yes stop_codon:yes gene_type:complete